MVHTVSIITFAGLVNTIWLDIKVGGENILTLDFVLQVVPAVSGCALHCGTVSDDIKDDTNAGRNPLINR